MRKIQYFLGRSWGQKLLWRDVYWHPRGYNWDTAASSSWLYCCISLAFNILFRFKIISSTEVVCLSQKNNATHGLSRLNYITYILRKNHNRHRHEICNLWNFKKLTIISTGILNCQLIFSSIICNEKDMLYWQCKINIFSWLKTLAVHWPYSLILKFWHVV